MSFKSTPLRDVRFSSQRALAAYWGCLASRRRFPALTEFELPPGDHDPKQLVIWNIEGTGANLKFRALYQGENVSEVFNSTWVGKTMDAVVPMSLRRISLDAAKECVTSRRPVYTIISTIDSLERCVDCERLPLPFGRHDTMVEQILTSLQLVNVPEGLQRKKILNNFQLQADLVFSGKIESGFFEESAGEIFVHPKRRGQPKALSPTASGPATATAGKRRDTPRRSVLRAGRLYFGRQSLTCTIRNISATGALIEVTSPVRVPTRFTLIIEMESTSRPCSVIWRQKPKIGIRFD